MAENDLLTRVAVLEVRMDATEKGIGEMKADVKTILAELQALDKEQAKAAVKIALIAAIGSAVLVEIVRYVLK